MSQSIWKNTNYVKFLVSSTVGNIGDWFDLFALQIIFAIEFHANASMIGFLWFVYILPMVIFSPLCGKWVDGLNKKSVMIMTDLICGFITLGMFIIHDPYLMFIAIALRGFFAAMNAPAQQAATQALVTKDQLLTASSYGSISFQLCRALGPLLGAFVVIFATARDCLLINSGSFFLSVLILLTMVYKDKVLDNKQKAESEEKAKTKSKVKSETKDSVWGFIQSKPILFWNIVLGAIISLLLTPTMIQAIILIRHIAPVHPEFYGFLAGFSGLGAILIGVYLSRFKKLKSPLTCYIWAALALGIADLLLTYYTHNVSVGWVIFVGLLDGLGMGIGFVIQSYVLKDQTPKKRMGAVSGFSSSLTGLSMMIGGVVSMGLTEWIGIIEMYRIVGGVLILAAVILMVLNLVKIGPFVKTN